MTVALEPRARWVPDRRGRRESRSLMGGNQDMPGQRVPAWSTRSGMSMATCASATCGKPTHARLAEPRGTGVRPADFESRACPDESTCGGRE